MAEEEKKAKSAPDVCPECGVRLSKWLNPDDSSWGTGYQLVCFNDDCPYFERGWKWMKEHYNVTASYRFRYNPVNGETGPLPVWSRDAGKGNIINEDQDPQ
jgi:hypothetical protein